MVIVRIDARWITDWDAYHDVFAEAFGFPNFFGRNGNAWIDCMGDLDDPEAGMTQIHVAPGQVLALQIDNAADLRRLPRGVRRDHRMLGVRQLAPGRHVACVPRGRTATSHQGTGWR